MPSNLPTRYVDIDTRSVVVEVLVDSEASLHWPIGHDLSLNSCNGVEANDSSGGTLILLEGDE